MGPPLAPAVQPWTRPENVKRLSGFIDEEGDRTDLLHPHGLVSKVTDPPGDAGRHTIDYTYNRLGQVKTAQESGHALDASTHYDNLFGDMTRQTTPENTVTEFIPDKMGRPLTITDALDNDTTNTNDNVGNLKSVRQPTGAGAFSTTNYFYTDRNQIEYETDPADAAITASTISTTTRGGRAFATTAEDGFACNPAGPPADRQLKMIRPRRSLHQH